MLNLLKVSALFAIPALAVATFASNATLVPLSLNEDLTLAAATATESPVTVSNDVATLQDWSYTFGGFRSFNFYNFGNFNSFGFRPRHFGFGGQGYGGSGYQPVAVGRPVQAPLDVSLNIPPTGGINTAGLVSQLQPIFSGALGNLFGGGPSYFNSPYYQPTPYYPQPVQIVINVVINIVQPQPEPPAQSPFCA